MRNVLLKEAREISTHRLLEATRKVDKVMNKIKVGNITELNDLVYVETAVVPEMLGVKNRKSTGIEPWWKMEEWKDK